jgi:L,D-peptidoglycan transpeptidase YkuD (ErfK/YbiS/YcfS/YnhG family)
MAAMNLLVWPSGIAHWGGRQLRCALGRGRVARDKREGDGATPAGAWPMRELLFRPDRVRRPRTQLPTRPIGPDDGWCDAPDDAQYNRPVTLPYRANAETLWRTDRLYDLVVPLGYNDDPPVPGAGSAIFLHLAAPRYRPTQGCVALARRDLLLVLAEADEQSHVIVRL